MEDSDENLAASVGHALEWNQFVDGLRETNRYVPGPTRFVETLIAASVTCTDILSPGTPLYRGRIMPVERALDTEPLAWEDVGAPTPDLARPGRLNPDGIPYFYSAFELDTSIAELRPWIDARITVARYEVYRDLRVLDLRHARTHGHAVGSLTWLSFMLGRPVHADDRFGYLGLQYIAESLKAKGHEGLLYDSALNPSGTNCALFVSEGIRPVSRVLYSIDSVKYQSARFSDTIEGLSRDLGFRAPKSSEA